MNIDHKDIDDIIVAYLSKKASKTEQVRLEKWLNESAENRTQFELLENVWKERSREPRAINSDEVFNKIWENGTGDKAKAANHQSIDLGYLAKIAAAIIILMVATIGVVTKFNTNDGIDQPIATEEIIIEKVNPAGQKSKIMLPDGSEIWLNSASSISYQENFNNDERVINLSGEAFFQVKKDSLRPFIVNTGSIKTLALGTSFNISAYPEDKAVQVALITGKVKVWNSVELDEEFILKPSDGISYDLKDDELTKMSINKEDVIAWKDGVLMFNGDDFQQFTRKIENWYGVEVLVQGQVPHNWKIRAQFDNEYLSNVMNTISFNKKFNYQLSGKKLFLTFK